MNNDTLEFCIRCLICGEVIAEYDHPIIAMNEPGPKVCEKCKAAVAFAKWLRNGRKRKEEE